MKKLIFISGLAFFALYAILAFNCRITADDFRYLGNVYRRGVWGGAWAEYNFWTTRWASVLLCNIVLYFIKLKYTLLVFGMVTLGLFSFSVYLLIKNILQTVYHNNITRFMPAGMTILFLNALFYATPGIGETWFWPGATTTYVWCIILLCLGAAMIISPAKFPVLKYIVIALSFFWAGGSSEAFASLAVIACVTAVIYITLVKPSSAGKRLYTYRLITALFFCIVALVILYLGKGNAVRQSYLPKPNVLKALMLNTYLLCSMALHTILSTLPYYALLFSMPFLLLGYKASLTAPVQKATTGKALRLLLIIAVIYSVMVFIQNYIITYLLSCKGPPRAMFSISFLSVALLSSAFFYAGYNVIFKPAFIRIVCVVSLALCICINIYNAQAQWQITSVYAKQYDNTLSLLLRHKTGSTVILLPPLPNPGMLKPLDIVTDTACSKNPFFRSALGIHEPFRIVHN